ncbi:MAG: hypothetical protein P1U57_02790 [Oleibacter sp.]|nr:hypothetical protein [Thalassolituus sp.]
MTLFKLLSLILFFILSSANVVAVEVSNQTVNEVGVIAGLRGQVFIERSGNELASTSGVKIIAGDHIRTRKDQIFQLILKDETVFTFAGDVDVSLDLFEYDKEKGTGRLQITQYAGLMKFSTGRIANGQAGVFNIRQPNSDIAVLGTTGVVGMLSAEQANAYFPQIPLPNTNEKVSYAALMGPGPRAARWVKSGEFLYTNDQGVVDLNKPGGSVLAVKGSAPIEFVAPALDISLATSYDDEESGNSNSGNSSTKKNDGAVQSGNLSSALPAADNIQSTDTNKRANGESGNGTLLRDIRTLLDNESMNRVIQHIEQTQGIPGQPAPTNTPTNNPTTDTTQDPINDLVNDPMNPGTGGIVCPGDPSCPVEPAPTDPGTGGMMCPGDPSCPIELAPFDPGAGGLVCPGDPACP